MSKSADNKSISKRVSELDEMVEWFYGDDFELDQALAKYQQANQLAGEIAKDLATLKNKIEVVEDFTKS